MADPTITIFVSLPESVQEPLDLNENNWAWKPWLVFPLAALNDPRFKKVLLKPFKWIHFATGVTLCAHGDLSYGPSRPAEFDYDQPLPTQCLELYYWLEDDEKLRMFPVDANLMDDRTSVHQVSTTPSESSSHAEFRCDIESRDGACVLSGMRDRLVCDPAHIIPHSKGDDYIKAVMEHRVRQEGDEIIEDINDVRNGIYLQKVFHALFGRLFAFLVVRVGFADDGHLILP
ncbi:hypothetical protein K488DRAFT_92230 [Vararia minispora EC-137]|uniref:Uncharacterized protein n=1 Tax=Vararia minispora EC-137 TaxID=1314806 RepID=A0ACB8Q4M1_9AGAM|nr:hypothetical protein K488DRAFT_92230 [Vararia minispora EC-137]